MLSRLQRYRGLVAQVEALLGGAGACGQGEPCELPAAPAASRGCSEPPVPQCRSCTLPQPESLCCRVQTAPRGVHAVVADWRWPSIRLPCLCSWPAPKLRLPKCGCEHSLGCGPRPVHVRCCRPFALNNAKEAWLPASWPWYSTSLAMHAQNG